jgi:tetratricopeptide (TPR) repeat protein
VRRVTLLRAGFALRSEADSAAEAGRVVESVLEKMRSFGGEVADLDPRGATAAFGLLPIEDAPRRAAHAALVIRQTLTRRRAGAGLRMALHTESLPVRAGAGGAGIDPDAARGVRAVLDDLLARAGAGEIALSPGAAAFLRGRFAITGPPAGTVHRLTGHAEPERELTGFVGRDRELRLLLERLDQAADGQGQAVTVVGEPGIGKSRLLRELRRALGRRAAWVEGRVASGGRATPLAALVDLLHRTLRIDDTDPEPVVIAKLERHALALGEGVAPLLPFLRYLLSVDPGDPAVAGMDPSVRRMAIFDAMRRLVFRAAEHEPQVVVIEDVHWIDQATEEWLRLVADGMVAQRVLLVSTTRPGYTPPFRERTFHTQIALAALSPADSVRMARTLMAAPELAAGLEQLIVAKTEGNPFFVEEVVRSLHEVGAVRREGDRLVLAAEAETLGLPDTVQDVILSRIERLEPELQAILELAAVIGTDVPYDVLAAVADRPDEALRAGLRALQAAEFLYETSLYPEWAHTFRHALTHDVAYGRLPPDRRRALHGRILAAIEQAHGTRLGDQAERLAYHACGAEAWAKAAAYCRQAGDRALERSAHGQAVAWFGETLAALARLPATPESVAAGIDVRFGLRSALIPLGNVARILRVLGEAETLAAAAGDRRRLGWTSAFMTIYHLLDGRHDRAREAGERAVRLADETADPGLAVVSRAYLGHVMRELGQHSMALALFEAVFRALPGDRALERFGQALQPAVYALSLGALSRAAVGGLTEAARMVDEARRISEVTARPFGLVLTGLVRAQLLTVRGAPGEAVLAAEQALGTIETHGLVLWRPWAHAVLGWAHALAGRCADGARHLELAIQDAEALPFRFGQSLWVIWLGLTHVLAGAFEPAAREAARALLLTRQRGECGYEAWAHYLAGEVASRRNPPDPAAAEAAYQAALAGAEPLAMRPLVAHSHAALERVLSLMCSTERAAAHRDQARAAYQALGLSAWPAPGGAALGAEGAP